MGVRIKSRWDSAANWVAENPILIGGEVGIENDTGRLKIGDGSKNWNTLDYFMGASSRSTTIPIEPVSDKDFIVAFSTPAELSNISLISRCESGTCTAQLFDDGAALDGAANAVSATEVTESHTDTVAAGSSLVLKITANVDCVNAVFQLKYDEAN